MFLSTSNVSSKVDITKCMNMLPLMHLDKIENIPMDQVTSRSIMMDFDTTSGLIYHGSAENLINNLFSKIGSSNPKIRILIFLDGDAEKDLLAKIFLVAWQKHRVCDLLIVIDNEFKKFFKTFNLYSNNLFTNDIERKLETLEFSSISSEFNLFIKKI